jgi:hypothetical protein
MICHLADDRTGAVNKAVYKKTGAVAKLKVCFLAANRRGEHGDRF